MSRLTPKDPRHLARRILTSGLPAWAWLGVLFRGLHRGLRLIYEALVLIKKVFWVEPMLRAVSRRVGQQLRIERMPYITGQGELEIGDRVYISGKIGIGFNSRPGLNPRLTIGSGTFVGHECSFNLADSITIGKHCLISSYTRFYDNDGHPFDPEARRQGQPVPADRVKPIVVGDDVWIGNRAIILKGVQIGDRAIIGAGSVVGSDVPSGSLASGNPAQIVGGLAGGAGGYE